MVQKMMRLMLMIFHDLDMMMAHLVVTCSDGHHDDNGNDDDGADHGDDDDDEDEDEDEDEDDDDGDNDDDDDNNTGEYEDDDNDYDDDDDDDDDGAECHCGNDGCNALRFHLRQHGGKVQFFLHPSQHHCWSQNCQRYLFC